MFDIAVIGGGVIGGTILRELTKYQLNVCMLESCDDVSMGQSKANSGIVHAGYDAKPNSLKAKFNVLGNKMMSAYASELGVKYQNNGSLVLAFSDEDLTVLEELKTRGETNGVERLSIIDRAELNRLEPNVSDKALGALYAPTGGIICPYELTIASIGNAMDNGAKLYCNFEVVSAKKLENGYEIISTDGNKVCAKIVINCAGINSGKVASIFGDDTLNIKGRKGEYILLDRESGDFVSHTLFCTPSKAGKGILVTQTVDGNILLGPTATEVDNPAPVTTAQGLAFVVDKVKSMCKNPPLFNSITSFAGVRAYSDKGDFIIEKSAIAENLINVAGIESPGLTSAPAIAKFVAEEIVAKMTSLVKNEKFNGKRTPDYFFKNLSIEEKNELIKKDSTYGKIICRCEGITEGEIIRAVRENPKAMTIDAVKRRTRAGMGRCQGGFCQPHVAEIIAREHNIAYEKVQKGGKNSTLLVGKVK